MNCQRVAVFAIIVKNPESAADLNQLLHQYGSRIIGRMGIPYAERNLRLISVAIDAPETEISALAGKLGRLPGVTVKVAYAPEDAV